MENTKSKETINTSNLKEGMRFKSYKALCEFIETKVKVGKLKQNQILIELKDGRGFTKENT